MSELEYENQEPIQDGVDAITDISPEELEQDEQNEHEEGIEGDHLEDSPESPLDNEGDAPEAPLKRGRDSAKFRISQLQREKFQALNIAEQLRQENESLRRLADLATNAATEQHDTGLAKEIERLKQVQAHAIETGDVEGQVNANLELSLATKELHDSYNWKAQQALRQQSMQPEYPVQAPPIQDNPIAREWFRNNRWIDPESPNYNERLSRDVQTWTAQFDENLYNGGAQHAIGTPEYFNEINDYIRKKAAQYNQGNRGQLNMKPTRSSVSPVRNGINPQANGKVVNQAEKAIIREFSQHFGERLPNFDKSYIASKLKTEQGRK